jgi:hypothetical protein
MSWQKSSKYVGVQNLFWCCVTVLAFRLCIVSWPNRDTFRRHCMTLDSILSVVVATLGLSFCWVLFSRRNKHYSLYLSDNLSCIESCPLFLSLLICDDSRLCSCRYCLCSLIHLQEKAFSQGQLELYLIDNHGVVVMYRLHGLESFGLEVGRIANNRIYPTYQKVWTSSSQSSGIKIQVARYVSLSAVIQPCAFTIFVSVLLCWVCVSDESLLLVYCVFLVRSPTASCIRFLSPLSHVHHIPHTSLSHHVTWLAPSR